MNVWADDIKVKKIFIFLNKVLSYIRFRLFEFQILRESRDLNKSIGVWAQKKIESNELEDQHDSYEKSSDPLVLQGYKLGCYVRNLLHNKHVKSDVLRILVHVPPAKVSPGGFSLFTNLVESLNYIGVRTECLYWGQDTSKVLLRFKPSVFITSDSHLYLNDVKWADLLKYKAINNLKIGLTASIQEYGNPNLVDRIKWAKKHDVDFYYSFRSQGYLKSRKSYEIFYENSFDILSVEFGANILRYYAVPDCIKDLDYVFLASSNADKRDRYYQYLANIFKSFRGLVDGPGWSFSAKTNFNSSRDKYLYARSKVGLNLHLEDQIVWPCEINERTYMLAACGVPQLCDNPRLLLDRFTPDSLFIAGSSKEYFKLFKEIIANPDESISRALKAQRQVYEKHTTLHRADKFSQDLLDFFE
jgi:hypothetical protein